MARILVVDDEPSVRFLLRRVLEGMGHSVTAAQHGAEALETLEAPPLPALVITDMSMPVMSGAQLIDRLRASRATAAIPILAVTGDANLAVDADAVVRKPFGLEQLEDIVMKLLSRPAGVVQ